MPRTRLGVRPNILTGRPPPVAQFRPRERHSVVDILPAYPQAEAQAVFLFELSDREQRPGVAVFLPVDLLPPPAFGGFFRLDPSEYGDRLVGFEAGVVGHLDALALPVEDRSLPQPAVSVVAPGRSINDCEKKQWKSPRDRVASLQVVHVINLVFAVDQSVETVQHTARDQFTVVRRF
jgi:hypothetical protein